jgi:hypothetical protein
MDKAQYPTAIVAAEALPRTKPSNYPEPFASRMAGRVKRALQTCASWIPGGRTKIAATKEQSVVPNVMIFVPA